MCLLNEHTQDGSTIGTLQYLYVNTLCWKQFENETDKVTKTL